MVEGNGQPTQMDSAALEKPSGSTPMASTRLKASTVYLVEVTGGGRDEGASSLGTGVSPGGARAPGQDGSTKGVRPVAGSRPPLLDKSLGETSVTTMLV